MGIYIENMKAPVTCCHCPLMGYDPDIEWADGGRETQGAYICAITHELIDNTKREEHCPLVYVPPHGRLIDADAYEALIRGLGNREYRRENGTICDAIKFLHPHYAPTIIPAEEGE